LNIEGHYFTKLDMKPARTKLASPIIVTAILAANPVLRTDDPALPCAKLQLHSHVSYNTGEVEGSGAAAPKNVAAKDPLESQFHKQHILEMSFSSM
jgi:hypothetical protein